MSPATDSPLSLEEKIQKAEAFIKTIQMPAQANIVIEINKEVSRPEPNIQRITDLVSRDVSISAAVIKTINSPYFGMRVQVVSINQALTLLGLNNFHKVVLAGQLQNVLSGGKGGGDFQKFWDHFMSVAKGAELVAKTFMKLKFYELEDQAFMAGLFHDCGIPLLISKHPEYVLETFGSCAGDPDKLMREEEKRYGFDHGCLSYVLARSWGLHDGVCQAILHHHRADAKIDNEYGHKVWIMLRLADYLAEYVNARNSRNINEYTAFTEREDAALLPEEVMDAYDMSVYDLGELKEFANEELLKYIKGGPVPKADDKGDKTADKGKPAKEPEKKKAKRGFFG